MPFERKCPRCNKMQTYAFYSAFYKANVGNKVCKSCCRKGVKFSKSHCDNISKGKVGKSPTIQHIIKNSNAQLLRFQNENERNKISVATKKALRSPIIRKRHIEALAKTRWLGKTFDKGQLELLEKWNTLGFNFIPNYQVYNNEFLGYIDGYDPINNIVIEYDSKYHKRLSQKKKDLIRQQYIIDILNPKKFWRYDAENKQWINVIG